MTINKKTDNGNIVFILNGRLDTTTAPKLQETLIPALEENVKQVILDFNGLAYVSSAGLRVLLMGQKTATKNNISMIIKNVPDEIMDVFNMTGFADMLEII